MKGSALALLAAAHLLGCGGDGEAPAIVYRAGGETTVEDRSSHAYSFPAPTLVGADLDLHNEGDAGFEASFVTGGAPVNNGLGPLFNNTACDRCHGRDGRGLARIGGGASSQSLVRVSLAAGDGEAPGGPALVPGLGTQLQNHAVFGRTPEARIGVEWSEQAGSYGDGTAYSLRAPLLQIELADGQALGGDVLRSLRQPPAVFGLGLLEAIDEATLVSWADPSDADDDGISGRVNYVWDEALGAAAVGRFGHKANTPNLTQQAAAAYYNDMGVSNPVFTDEDGSADIDLATIEAVAFYTRTLAVPAPTELSAEAERGRELFAAFGCDGCHKDQVRTGDHPVAILADQAIAPYTDLLLHDLGEGLADGRPDYLADGREWRTAPLWGIGLVQTVQYGSGYLHDGRARTLAEAVLWHGGEASSSAEEFREATEDDRDALVAFLSAL